MLDSADDMDGVVTLDSTSSALARKLREQAEQQSDFHLSVVATSRNDDHGGNLLQRMQHFVDGLAEQCRRHDLSAELILVEWNPPADRPSLAEALRWPEDTGPCAIRIITVPREVHATFAHSDRLPVFQMVAKNVGIRRARGRFVLATNIDILFSDAIIRFMRNNLKPGHVYRVDRCDVPPDLPTGVPFEHVLAFCERETFRINRRRHTYVKSDGNWIRQPPLRRGPTLAAWFRQIVRQGFSRLRRTDRSLVLGAADVASRAVQRLFSRLHRAGRVFVTAIRDALARAPRIMLTDPVAGLRGAMGVGRQVVAGLRQLARVGRRGVSVDIRRFPRLGAAFVRRSFRLLLSAWRRLICAVRWRLKSRLHTNACGDFTLMSREDWFALRGYPEWEMFSWHIDSVLLFQADRNGIREVDLSQDQQVFHIEHCIGSGYTPEGQQALFARLESNGIPYLAWEDFVRVVTDMDRQRKTGKSVSYNTENWGISGLTLPEVTVVPKVPAVTAAGVSS